jgi:GNAT superfamily N-acetyltransferase
MEIHRLKPEEYLEAMLGAHGVFDYCIKAKLSDRYLVDGFNAYAEAGLMQKKNAEGKGTLWGVFDENRMVGMSAMQSEGHITMLYVYSAFQRRGYGSSLLNEMRTFAASEYGHQEVTLNALPPETADYFLKRGFHPDKSAKNEAQKLPFVPLLAKTIGSYKTYEKKPIPNGVILGTSLAGLLICIVVAIVFMAVCLL